jgi:hypothetical protein
LFLLILCVVDVAGRLTVSIVLLVGAVESSFRQVLFLAKKNRTIELKSKKVVQLFNHSSEFMEHLNPLPKTAKDIFGVLAAEGVAAQAAVVAGVGKSAVSYWVKYALKAGILVERVSQNSLTFGRPTKEQRYSAGRPKYYDLTSYGSKLLTGSDGFLRLPVVFEDMPVKFLVLCWERSGSIDWQKLGQPRNWIKLGFRVTGVRVVKTPKYLIIHPGSLKGFDVDQLEVESGRIIERVRNILEIEHGMQLADDPTFLHGPRWQVFRPEAKQWIQAGTVDIPGIGALDASPKPSKNGVKDPLSKEPHVEFNDKRHAAIAAAWPAVASDPSKRNAAAAPMYPFYLEEIHRSVTGLTNRVDDSLEKLERLEKESGRNTLAIEKITGILSRLFEIEPEKQVTKVIDGGKDYVA